MTLATAAGLVALVGMVVVARLWPDKRTTRRRDRGDMDFDWGDSDGDGGGDGGGD